MKSKINFEILLLSSLLFSFASFAQTSSAGNSDAKPVVSSSSADIKNSADKAQSQNKKSQGISQIIGVANMGLGAMYVQKGAACSAQCGAAGGGCCSQAPMLYAKGALHFLMGAMSFKQAGANGKAAGQAGATGYDTSSANPFGDPDAQTNHLDPNVDSTKDKNLSALVNTKKLNEIKRDLMGKGIGGVKMDSKGILTTPDGKTYDSNQLTDAAAMAKAGFSDSDINAALAANKAFEKAAIKKVGADTVGIGAATAENGFSDGGGGANYGSASSMDQRSGGGYADKSRNPANTNKIAGLTKNFNGERIGVAAENIFNMMTRRYKTKEKQDSFFDPSELIPLTQ